MHCASLETDRAGFEAMCKNKRMTKTEGRVPEDRILARTKAEGHREIHEIRETRGKELFAYFACFAVYENEAILRVILEGRSE